MSVSNRYDTYYSSVFRELEELKREYPFVKIIFEPTVEPKPIRVQVTAVSSDIIRSTLATESDFLGPFSKALEVIIPFSYKTQGCEVYGGEWINLKDIEVKYQHFNGKRDDGKWLFCVGVPDSFETLENVILENIRTADKMLVAYQLLITGKTNTLELKAYNHGKRGIDEYRKSKAKERKKV